MGRIWRDGKLVDSVGESRNCRSGCAFPTDDEPFGFGVGVGAAGYKGTSQAYLRLTDFQGSGETLFIRDDKRVYEERQGLITCLAPAKPPSDEPSVYVEDVDWKSFPPLDQLAWLFYNFFCSYTDREVVMLVGKERGKLGWLYYVPEQVGTCSSVKWTANDEEMDQFQERAQWIGTIHSHPGNCCKPSQTDIDDWAEPEKSGLHVVFGRDGSFTVNGAIAGRTFELHTDKVHRGLLCHNAARYHTSKGRTLAELLKKPKPAVVRIVQRGAIHTPVQPKPGLWGSNLPLWDESDDKDFVEGALDVVGALPLVGKGHDIPVLRIVEYDGQFYALTLSQYAELVEWCRDVCPVPKSKRLRLYGTKGGRK